MSDFGDKAAQFHKSGFNCTQSVVRVFCESLDMPVDKAMQIAAGFGGGMGRQGGICGAISGACIVLGLKYGATDPADKESKSRTYQKVQQLMQGFCSEHKSLDCSSLLGYDISTDEGFARAKENDAFKVCDGYIKTAVKLVQEL